MAELISNENIQLERDQDYNTTITETEINTETNNKDINKLKNENKKLIEFMKNNDININELIKKKYIDLDSIFINIDDSETESDSNIDKKDNKDNKNNNNNNNNNKENKNKTTQNTSKKLITKADLNIIAPEYFRQHIIEKYIRNNLEDDIKEATSSRTKWAQTATAMFCISEILMVIQTALSFTAATYQIILISYLAGVVGVVAIGLTRFGAYSRNQSNEKNSLYNKLLQKIGINASIPNLLDIDDKKNKNND